MAIDVVLDFEKSVNATLKEIYNHDDFPKHYRKEDDLYFDAAGLIFSNFNDDVEYIANKLDELAIDSQNIETKIHYLTVLGGEFSEKLLKLDLHLIIGAYVDLTDTTFPLIIDWFHKFDLEKNAYVANSVEEFSELICNNGERSYLGYYYKVNDLIFLKEFVCLPLVFRWCIWYIFIPILILKRVIFTSA